MEQLPLIRAPNYLGEFADTMAQFDANSAARLKAELDARRGALGSILGNSERLAGLGGSGTIDQLLGSFTSMDQPLFDTDYARQMDDLRMIGAQADIAATNRSGAGGGGGGSGGGKAGEWIVRDPRTGMVTRFDPADLDAATITKLTTGETGLEVLQYGANVDDATQQRFGAQPPPSGSGDTIVIDGVTYDTITGEIVQ